MVSKVPLTITINKAIPLGHRLAQFKEFGFELDAKSLTFSTEIHIVFIFRRGWELEFVVFDLSQSATVSAQTGLKIGHRLLQLLSS